MLFTKNALYHHLSETHRIRCRLMGFYEANNNPKYYFLSKKKYEGFRDFSWDNSG